MWFIDRLQKWAVSRTNARFPEACRGMTCGAKTRAATPCKQKALYDNGRCKFHGGLSTGPRSVEGKAKSALNGYKQTLSERQDLDKGELSSQKSALL